MEKYHEVIVKLKVMLFWFARTIMEHLCQFVPRTEKSGLKMTTTLEMTLRSKFMIDNEDETLA